MSDTPSRAAEKTLRIVNGFDGVRRVNVMRRLRVVHASPDGAREASDALDWLAWGGLGHWSEMAAEEREAVLDRLEESEAR